MDSDKLTIIGLAVGLIAFAFFIIKGCSKNATAPSPTITLAPDATHHTVVGPTRIETLERVKGTDEVVRKDVVNYHHGVEFEVKKDGSIKVIQNTQGFSNDFGLTLGWKNIGVGNEFFYWRNISVLGGSQFINLSTQRLQLNLWVGVGYRFSHPKFNNVSVYGGFDTDRHVIGGLFLRLGSV